MLRARLSTLVLAGVFGTLAGLALFQAARAEIRTPGRPDLTVDPAQGCEGGRVPTLAARSAQVAALKLSMERSLTRYSPNFDFKPDESRSRLFGGSYDWHSSVHEQGPHQTCAVKRVTAFEAALIK